MSTDLRSNELPPISWARKFNLILILGLAPQALCFRLLRRLRPDFCESIPAKVRRELQVTSLELFVETVVGVIGIFILTVAFPVFIPEVNRVGTCSQLYLSLRF